MRPGDHPDFYRLAAPFGASRESSIVLDRQGRFFHEGREVEQPWLRQAFFRWLRRHPDNGRYILSNGYDWIYLQAETPAFWVEALRSEGEELVLLFSDGSTEPARAPIWEAGERLQTYHRGKGLVAELKPAAQASLAPWLVELDGGYGLRASSGVIPIAHCAPVTGP